MVLIKDGIASTLVPTPCELRLESARLIRYIAPKNANPRQETRSNYHGESPQMRTRKNSFYDASSFTQDDWEGVNTLCQYIDTVMDIERETDFFDGKTVLEIGFSTGLPSVLAMDSGAAEVSIHCATKSELDCFVKPTLRRNKIPANKCKFSSGGLEDLKKALGGKKFDVILAPEMLNCNLGLFEQLHEILDSAMAQDGICFLVGRTHYFHCDGSIPAFQDLVKRNRKFDWLQRWSSERADIVQMKVIQLTRAIY